MEEGHHSKDQYVTGLLNLVDEWLVRGLVLSSFMAYLVLALFAGVRRHRASGWRILLLWPAYPVAELAAAKALAKLTLGSTSQELQLVAFWTPFLLMHLSRPDNISAYSFEDNVLGGRKVLSAPTQFLFTIYVLYKHMIADGDAGALLPASFIMFFLGIAKYMEGVAALWSGKLENIRSSIKTPLRISSDLLNGGQELNSEQALLLAHDHLYITKGAFTDCSFGKNPLFHHRSRISPSHGWESKCMVVEMQLSLMYDIMYTKATVVHTWLGYGIRVLSPPFTAAALSLFYLHNKDGQRRADVVITYILLVATFIMDVKWLLGALGSTWKYAFMKEGDWSESSLERWCGLRRFLVSLDPSRLFIEEPTRYRMWPGTIGRYNLLHECSHDTTDLRSRLVKIIAPEDIWMEYHYGYLNGIEILPFVRDLLFKTVWGRFESAYGLVYDPPDRDPPKPSPPEHKPSAAVDKKPASAEPITVPNQRAGHINRRVLDEALEMGPEFQEVILTWHIATEVFLLCGPNEAALFKYVEAIKELSNYMMFLVVVRPNMLPGLKLPSLHEATREALTKIWLDNKSNSCYTNRAVELARIMRNMEWRSGSNSCTGSSLYDLSVILSDGTQYADLMISRLRNTYGGNNLKPENSKDMLKNLVLDLFKNLEWDLETMLLLVFNTWVRLLIHASIRCSRESHAKQLGRGGELTTIIWILAEHAAIHKEMQPS